MRDEEKQRSTPPTSRHEGDELSQYGDEQDAPARKKRAGSAAKGKKKARPTKPKAAPSKKAPKRKKRRSFFEWLFSGTTPRRRSGGKLVVFGREVALTFWPVFLVCVAVLLVIVVFVQSSSLVVDEQQVTMVGLSSDLEGYRILHLSDLAGKRFGDEQATLLREIETLDYDAVFITGDMVGEGGDPTPFYELLEGLPGNKPVYFIAGDSDPGPVLEVTRDITGTVEEMVLEDWVLGAMDRGAIYVDAPVELTVGNSSIWITPATMLNLEASETLSTLEEQMYQEQEGTLLGLSEDHDTLPITTYRYQCAQELLNAVDAMTETDVHISLAHEPPSDDYLAASASHAADERYLTQPSLVMAGHYCGGVWRLPLVGAFYVSSSTADRHGWFPAQEDVQGLSVAGGGTQMYITGGLSTSGSVPLMPFRFLNRPQISIIELTATLPQNMLEQ